jgi:hypothetical protein
MPSDVMSKVISATCKAGLSRVSRESEGARCCLIDQIVERDEAFRQRRAETADMTDGENLGGDLHRKRCVIGIADAHACDQRLGADPRQAPPRTRCGRHRSGNGAAIMPARMMPSSVRMLSDVLGNCVATIESADNPISRSRAANRGDDAVACTKVRRWVGASVKASRLGGSMSAMASGCAPR